MSQDRAPSLLLVLWIVSALLPGCDTDGSPPPPTEAAAFPWPELDGVEADVREHLIETRATLESALSAEADSLSLGQAFGEAGIVYHGYALRMAARSAYSRAEALDPRSARWPYLRGHTLRVGEDVQGAVEAFRSALDRDGGLVAAWIALGEVLFDLDRTEEAEAAFASVVAGEAEPLQFAALLAALKTKGEVHAELMAGHFGDRVLKLVG